MPRKYIVCMRSKPVEVEDRYRYRNCMNKIRLLSFATISVAAAITIASHFKSEALDCFSEDASWEQVVADCSDLLEREELSRSERVAILLRRAYVRMPHQQDLAKKDYLALLETAPNTEDAINNLGVIYLKQDAPEKALPLFERLVAAKPGSALYHRNRAEAYYDLERYEAALADANIILNVNAEHKSAMWLRAHSLEALEKYDEALEAYSQMIRDDRDNDSARRKRSWIYYRHLKLREHALIDLRHILKKNPDDHYTLARLGYVLLKQDRYFDAVEAFESSVSLKPDYEYAQKGLKRARSELSGRQAANARLSTPESREIAGIGFGNILAGNFLAVGETARALTEYDNVLLQDPANDLAHIGKARVYYDLGEDIKVISSTEEFLTAVSPERERGSTIDQVVSVAYTRMGNSHHRMGNVEAAVTSWEKGLDDELPYIVSLWQLRLESAGYFYGWPDGKVDETLIKALHSCASDPNC